MATKQTKPLAYDFLCLKAFEKIIETQWTKFSFDLYCFYLAFHSYSFHIDDISYAHKRGTDFPVFFSFYQDYRDTLMRF